MNIDYANDSEATELFGRLSASKRPEVIVAGYEYPSPFIQWLAKHHPDFPYKLRFGNPKKPKFSRWSQMRFFRWLQKQYPDPGTRLVQVTLNVHLHGGVKEGGFSYEMTLTDDYKSCMIELAYELWMNREEEPRIEILIKPAPRREKKEMWARIKNKSE